MTISTLSSFFNGRKIAFISFVKFIISLFGIVDSSQLLPITAITINILNIFFTFIAIPR